MLNKKRILKNEKDITYNFGGGVLYLVGVMIWVGFQLYFVAKKLLAGSRCMVD